MQKRTGLLIAGIAGGLLLLVVLFFGWVMSVNNRLVSMNEGVQEKWSQVENVYQRRADLVPNLVATVKGYAKHESEVFTQVTQARAQVGQIKVNSAEELKNFDQAQTGLTSALSRLMVVAERYPELKADRGFGELQSQLEGTENRITVERMRFNEEARGYNTYLKQFPQNFIASFRGFQERAYFQADAAAKTAPKVEF